MQFRFLIFFLLFTVSGLLITSPVKAAPRFLKKQKNIEEKVPIDELHKKTINLYRLGKYSKAEIVAERALRIARQRFGYNDPNEAKSMYNMALIYQAQGKEDLAEIVYQQSMDILSKFLIPDKLATWIIKDALKILYNSRGKPLDLKLLSKQAKIIGENDLLPDHFDIALILNNLAAIYKNKGKYDDAASHYTRALGIWKKNLGKDHPNVKIVQKNLEILSKVKNQAKKTEDRLLKKEQLEENGSGEPEENKSDETIPVASSGDPERGQAVYELRCAGCHGMKGDGKGATAKFLNPRPRDFRKGKYKIRTTPSGKLPTDQNMFDTISRGIPGTAMPTWRGVISDIDIADVLQYEKKFSKKFARWKKKKRPLPEITVGPEIPSSPESIEKGRKLYMEMECWKCHGKSGRGSGPSNPHLSNDWGDPIVPANFHKPWNLRGGSSREAIYLRFNTGLMGTPMPSFLDILGNEKSWHLVNFIKSLGPEEKPKAREVLISRFVDKDIPMNYDDPIWQNAEKYFVTLVGEVILEARRFWSNTDSMYVKTLHNKKEIAFLLEWDDSTQSPVMTGEELPNQCNDALFMQFPQKAVKKARKPYFFPGKRNKEGVDLWFWESTRMECRGPIDKSSGKKKFGDIKEKKYISRKAVYDDGRWLLVIKKPMKSGVPGELQFETEKFIPVSFHAQDGLLGDIDKESFLPFWRWLVLEPEMTVESYFYTSAALKETK